jgi:hypothetical protein
MAVVRQDGGTLARKPRITCTWSPRWLGACAVRRDLSWVMQPLGDCGKLGAPCDGPWSPFHCDFEWQTASLA